MLPPCDRPTPDCVLCNVQSSSKGHFLVARFLIDKGSDVNHVDASGCTVHTTHTYGDR